MENFFRKKSVKRKKKSVLVSDASESDEREETSQNQVEADPIVSDEEPMKCDIRDYKKKGNQDNINAYKNSINFVKAIQEARKFEKSHDKLIIIAGACQSDYEELIKAGANFASSPKRVNIHALDPAIIATKMSLSDVRKDIDLKDIIENTKYGKNGIGGVITKGTMYTGYPR